VVPIAAHGSVPMIVILVLIVRSLKGTLRVGVWRSRRRNSRWGIEVVSVSTPSMMSSTRASCTITSPMVLAMRVSRERGGLGVRKKSGRS
jgi:hypothetical protein